MNNKLFCNRAPQPRRNNWLLLLACAAGILACRPHAFASDAPQWMHALVNAPLPAYDEKTNAVLVYSERNVSVISADKMNVRVREAYKILRPEGRERGIAVVSFNPQKKIKNIQGWCIPAQGKDYEVKEKDSIETSPNTEGGELITDTKYKILHIPASEIGNIVGYEYEIEEQPIFLQDIWDFQGVDPVREAHYSLLLPAGWEFKSSWLNHGEVNPTHAGGNSWEWSVSDVKGIRPEPRMPPMAGIQGEMVLSFFSVDAPAYNANADWKAMGRWYLNLVGQRVDASPGIKQQVASLTGSKATVLEKMQAIGAFVQHDIRYVGIELGIGGFQPHPAAEIFLHRYGDCKDKATLVRSMLREIGVESYYLVINDRRGTVTGDMPAHSGFNHMITAIKLPVGLEDPSLVATVQNPKLGRLLFFDPTNELIPFGQLPGYEQGSYALLVAPEGGELIQMPEEPPSMNSIRRTAKLTLDPAGGLTGDVEETRLGHRASAERMRLRKVAKDADRVKPIEEILAGSLSTFHITHASLINFQQTDQPFGYKYSFVSNNYAKNAGNLLLLRPRVIGIKEEGFLETKEPRKFAVELEEPTRDTDTFEITIPSGYVVDDLPPAVDADFGFASYHAKTVVKDNVVDYTRTFEIKELSVPADKAEELRKLYRIIATDERNTVVLKSAH